MRNTIISLIANKELILVITAIVASLCAVIGTLFAIFTYEKTAKYLTYELRPWIIVKDYSYTKTLGNLKSIIRIVNVGKTPAKAKIEVNYYEDDNKIIPNTKEYKIIHSILPGQEFDKDGFIMDSTRYAKIINDEYSKEIFQEIIITYGTNDKNMKYKTYIKSRLNKDKFKESFSGQTSYDIWNILESDAY